MSEPESSEEETKIVVDSDWKEQVAKEKEQAADEDDFVPASHDSDEPNDTNDQTPPPASFEVMVTMLFTQAMAMLGQIPNPATGKAEINKPFAKHYIDSLEMLGEKTKGNLTDDEANTLSDALHALRMAYVDTKG